MKLNEMPPEEAAGIAQEIGLMPGDPRLAEVVEVRNDVSRLDVDIIVEEGPNVATLQQEEFATIAELEKAGVPIPPDALIEASGLRNKEKIIESMKTGGADPDAPPPPPSPEQLKAMAEAKEADARAAEAGAKAKEAEAKAQMAQLQLQVMMASAMMPAPMPAPQMVPQEFVGA